jgi:radical SAM superfamily enzyme YgiQ (UPF0313 family)
MRIALLNPPLSDGSLFTREGRCTQKASLWGTQWPPISLAYLAAIAKRDGHSAMLLDCPAEGIDTIETISKLRTFDPELCVFPISTPSLANDFEVIAEVKRALGDTRTAVFGVHATYDAPGILEGSQQVDFVLRNEPEGVFRELATALAERSDLNQVKGLSYSVDGQTIRNDDAEPIPDLNTLPAPAWEEIQTDIYRLPFSRRKFLSVAPMRGCPYGCTFCTARMYYGRKLRLRSAESVIAELNRDIELFGVRDFFMWAETFTLDRQFVLELSRAIVNQVPGIRWTCNSRTDTVDAEMLEAMARAGCWMISFGIESSDPTVQKNIRKGLKNTDLLTPLVQAREAGIKTVGHFILGLPGDTETSIRKTVDVSLKMDLDFAQFYAAAPFLGSDLHEQSKAEGWLPETTSFESMEQTAASLALPGLPAKLVDRLRKIAVLRFYCRPRQILRLTLIARLGLFTEIFRMIGWEVRRLFERLRARY